MKFIKLIGTCFYFCSLQGPEQIHVSKFYKESKTGKFVNYITDDATTLYETFRKGAYESNNGPCLGWRESLTSPYSVSVKIYIITIIINWHFLSPFRSLIHFQVDPTFISLDFKNNLMTLRPVKLHKVMSIQLKRS